MSNIKNISDDSKPRERLLRVGSENLSNQELLAILLKTGSKKYSVMELSFNLLSFLGDIKKLNDIGINSLLKLDGIGMVKAIELKAAIELGKRVFSDNYDYNKTIFCSADIVYNFYKFLVLKKQEYFYCLYLDTKKRMIESKCLFVGTLNMSIVSTREIFREALLLSAASIICVHNHPSGDSKPSKQDVMITNKIKEVGLIHEIPLVDHVIIGKDNYYSFFN